MRRTRSIAIATASAVVAAAVAAAAAEQPHRGLPQGSEPVALDPADFTTTIDNPYWPMRPGTRWLYRETAPDGTRQKVVVTVTTRTKRIANGVTARVVHDRVTEGRRLVEDTLDWYAQDRRGNIWYLGERTKEYENGKLTCLCGSFEAGRNRAQAGIVMPANPVPGLAYRQEYLQGQAEDKGSIFSLAEQAQVPAGHFADVVMTRDTNPLEPKVLEYKFFARGVGPVLEIGVSGDNDREELVSFRRGR